MKPRPSALVLRHRLDLVDQAEILLGHMHRTLHRSEFGSRGVDRVEDALKVSVFQS
jgi:hypothetical protein